MTTSTSRGDEIAQQRVEAAIAVLRDRSERVTLTRRLVLAELARADDHLTADDLYERISAHTPGVHLATVYRTIEALVRAGVAAHVHLPHGAATYHLIAPGERVHLHVVCRSCDRLVDVPSDLLDEVSRVLAAEHGFHLDADHVALTGWCDDCVPAGVAGHGTT
jgi:Fur family ferric uptake transcriptional regulator